MFVRERRRGGRICIGLHALLISEEGSGEPSLPSYRLLLLASVSSGKINMHYFYSLKSIQ